VIPPPPSPADRAQEILRRASEARDSFDSEFSSSINSTKAVTEGPLASIADLERADGRLGELRSAHRQFTTDLTRSIQNITVVITWPSDPQKVPDFSHLSGAVRALSESLQSFDRLLKRSHSTDVLPTDSVSGNVLSVLERLPRLATDFSRLSTLVERPLSELQRVLTDEQNAIRQVNAHQRSRDAAKERFDRVMSDEQAEREAESILMTAPFSSVDLLLQRARDEIARITSQHESELRAIVESS
jgi:hypothetical protein